MHRKPPAFTTATPLGKTKRNSPASSSMPITQPVTNRAHMILPSTRRVILTGAISTVGIFFMGSKSPSASANAMNKVQKSDSEWRAQLTDAQYRVLRQAGTERSFTSPLNIEKRNGVYLCAACANPLFSSDTKYDSGTGWPSFFKPLQNGIAYRQSASDVLFMTREVLCKKCDGHLGHVFKDGPRPTGERYCMNGVALKFVPSEKSA